MCVNASLGGDRASLPGLHLRARGTEPSSRSGKSLPAFLLYHKSLNLLSRGKAVQAAGLYRSVPVNDLLILWAGVFHLILGLI